VETFPPIKADANRTWGRVYKKAERELEKTIGMLAHRNDIIWGNGQMKMSTFRIRVNLDGGYRKKKGQPQQQQNPQQVNNY
jgi:hypothetical protein